jgi:hypothetical protein
MVRDLIWNDFIHAKFGDEYLCLYLKKQKLIRKAFKISTILLSGGGIASLFQPYKLPTIILLALIGISQAATSIENFIIHSEDDLDKLSTLRLFYYEHSNDLEKLWHSVYYNTHDEEVSVDSLFTLRKSANKIEELDNKLNVRYYKGLERKAYEKTINYINTNYNGQITSNPSPTA